MNAPVRKEDLSAPADAEFVEALRQANRALVSYLVCQAHVSGLGLIEYLILGRACDEEGVTARDAARAFDLSTSTMTGISDRLEKDKLVRRHSHPTDRRILVLKATRRGRGVIERTTAPLLADLSLQYVTLDPMVREVLIRALRQISGRLSREL